MSQHPILNIEHSLLTSCGPVTCVEVSLRCEESPDPDCNSAGQKSDSPANEKDDSTLLQQNGNSHVFNPLPLTEAPKEIGSGLSSSSIEMVMVEGTGYDIRPLPLTQTSEPKVPSSTPLSTDTVMPGLKGYMIKPLQLTQAPKPRARLSRSSSTETVIKVGTGPESSFLPLTNSPRAESRASSTPITRGSGNEHATPPPTSDVHGITLTPRGTSAPGEVMLDEESLAAYLPRQPKSKGKDLEASFHTLTIADESDSESGDENVYPSSSRGPDAKWKGKEVSLLVEAKMDEDNDENQDDDLQLTRSPSHPDTVAQDTGSSSIPAAAIPPPGLGGFCADPNCDSLHRRSWSWPVGRENTEAQEGRILPW